MAGLPIAQHHKTNQKTIIIHTSQTFFVVISSKRIILTPFLRVKKCIFTQISILFPHSSRNTCSAVAAIFSIAFSFFIASSNVVTPLTIGKNASIPA